VLAAVCDTVGLDKAAVDDIVVGNVLTPGSFATQGRMAVFMAGFPSSTSMHSVNRQCSSGLQAVAEVAAAITAGFYDVGIAAGVESMSKSDMMGSVGPLNNAIFTNADAKACLVPMGITSENVAAKYGVTREQQDTFALESHRRALHATKTGRFAAEIVPITTTVTDQKTGKTETIVVKHDDGPREGLSPAALGKLRAVFQKGGSTTAGNASQMSDGAAAVLLMKRSTARRRNLPIIGTFRSFAVKGCPPLIMGIGPAVAIPAALKKAYLSTKDIDVYEVNEAFASQAVYCCRHLGLDAAKVNPNGGAIALGHPLGCTGARQVATVLSELKRTNGRYGMVSMCIGTGMGAACVLERE
jgi:acetyl-CoA acyltransferase 1